MYFLLSIFNALSSFSDDENRSSQSACFISQCILHTSVATYGVTILWKLLRIVSRKICSRLKSENDRRISNKCKSKANNGWGSNADWLLPPLDSFNASISHGAATGFAACPQEPALLSREFAGKLRPRSCEGRGASCLAYRPLSLFR